MVISFDYDHTLTKPSIKNLAIELLLAGYKVVVVSNRYDQHYNDLHGDIEAVFQQTGLRIRPYLLKGKTTKAKMLKRLNAAIHFDDDAFYISDIEKHTSCKCINVFGVGIDEVRRKLAEIIDNKANEAQLI